ncbi:MAG: adenosylcobinamide-phosphate synthase CbiB [Anaerolineales bacterium]|nr:adenosylcobinamide-phosphate synthase CbiB [Anaerolineales bacterium]
MKWNRLLLPWLALLLDEGLGDPPNRWHPVAWLGSLIAKVEGWVRRGEPRRDFWSGLGVWLGCVILVGSVLKALVTLLRKLPQPLAILGEAFLLKLTISQRGLRQAALDVEQALQAGDLPKARRQLGWHLVSRNTQDLDESQVAGATIESVAENTSDGILAPLIYYIIGGLPLAWVYRFANTLDSMWGYRNERYEWLGKAAARMDDLLNWLPARFSAGMLVLASSFQGENSHQALAVIQRDARTTASPNAGYPMSAMAGALGVELEKVGHYRLGHGLPPPKAEDIRRAVRLMQTSVLLGAGMLSVVSFLFLRGHRRT